MRLLIRKTMQVCAMALLFNSLRTASLKADTSISSSLSLSQLSELWAKGCYSDAEDKFMVEGILGVKGVGDLAREDANAAQKSFHKMFHDLSPWASGYDHPVYAFKDGMWFLTKSKLYPPVLGVQMTLYCAWYYAAVFAKGNLGITNPFVLKACL